MLGWGMPTSDSVDLNLTSRVAETFRRSIIQILFYKNSCGESVCVKERDFEFLIKWPCLDLRNPGMQRQGSEVQWRLNIFWLLWGLSGGHVYLMDDCLQRLLDEIESHEEELSNMVLHDRIAKLIRIRLEMQAPFISKWAQALSIQANPLNIPTSFKQRAALMDEIWHAAGDRSTDIDWYAKRTLLGGIYTATELYMLTDYSPEFRDTWTFLGRRIRDAFDCRKTAQEATQLASAIATGLGNTLQAFLRRQ